MKALLSSLVLLMSVSAQAETSKVAQTLNALKGENCLNELETALHDFTHPSAWMYVVAPVTAYSYRTAAKTAVLSNIENYKMAVMKIIGNLKNGRYDENIAIYQKIQNNIDLNKQSNGIPGDFTGYSKEFTRNTASCIERHVNFEGTAAEQLATARAAIHKIENLKKAVQ
jgi:hypothetical protein